MEGKRHGVHPLDGIPGFTYFPIELWYGYLRFEGNANILLGRQGKSSALSQFSKTKQTSNWANFFP